MLGTSTTTIQDNHEPGVRSRKRNACDVCRRSKARCERDPAAPDAKCTRCAASKVE
ncbi:hypothetical protein BDV98DRAFT_577875 [Pterulicium gracile]|uniref:Zn(2)-C6 fungal-type domain-containing protein n=1 Tax=Pterulicium gracile TaxID=1884261 RepID=A0A5C3QA70_9AGAR|nr:hypothetical protein BDV98DRAFT_577875 [Pterula gracilis]